MPRHDAPREYDPAANTWDRQSWETDKAWAAFVVFRDLPPRERSIPRAASDYNGRVRIPTWYDWQADNRWQERAGLWDRHQDQVRQRAQLQESIAMGERTAQQAQQLASALMMPAAALALKLRQDPTGQMMQQLADEDPKVLIQLTAMAAKVWPGLARAEQLARGVNTEHLLVTIDQQGTPSEPPPRRTRARLVELADAFADVRGLDPPPADA